MARVKQLLVHGTNQPGTLAQVCTEMAKVAVNISAIMATPGATGVIRIVATPHATAQKVLDNLGMAYSEEEAIAVRATDEYGREHRDHLVIEVTAAEANGRQRQG